MIQRKTWEVVFATAVLKNAQGYNQPLSNMSRNL